MWIEDLTEALVALHRSDRGFVIVQLAGTPHYVQLLRDEGRRGQPRVLVEAVSNEYLSVEGSLTREQEAALTGLGWHDPGSGFDPVEDCEMEHLNWFRFIDLEASGAGQGSIVGVVLATLGVYGMAEGAGVTVNLTCSTGPAAE